MRILALTTILVLCTSGCDWLMPTVEKSRTEKKQLEQMKRQSDLLERIAVALEGR